MIYFKEEVSKSLLNIYKHRFISFLANGFFGVFSIFFLYKILGESLQNLALFFSATSLGYILLMPFLRHLVNKIGFKKVLILGWVINIFIMLTYFLLAKYNGSYFLLTLLIILPIFFRVTYWVPYHTMVADTSTKSDRAKTLSVFSMLANVIGIFMPVLAGYLAENFGYEWLFLLGIIFTVIALFPLMSLESMGEKITWKSKDFFKKFINPKDKKFALAVFARGLETSVGIVVWPIFIFELLKGNLLEVGILSSVITIFVIIINIIQGKITDDKNLKKKFVKYGSWLYSFGWFLKIFGTTAFYIFIIDVYHRITSVFSFTPFDALVYDHIADKGHLLDENTILKEMTLHGGKVTGFLLIAFTSSFIDLNYLFFIAIIGTLLLSVIPEVDMDKI